VLPEVKRLNQRPNLLIIEENVSVVDKEQNLAV